MKNGLMERPKVEPEIGTRRLKNIDLLKQFDMTPYEFKVNIEGVAPILFHRYDCDSVEAKGNAKKGSAEKKTDDVESYVYRCKNGTLGIPSYVIHACLVRAGKYLQDPRSPRKSASDLIKAALIVSPTMC